MAVNMFSDCPLPHYGDILCLMDFPNLLPDDRHYHILTTLYIHVKRKIKNKKKGVKGVERYKFPVIK